MGMLTPLTDIGGIVKAATGIDPKSEDGTGQNGSSIDRSGFASCVLVGQNGAATGSPTSYTVDFKLQESADGSTGWSDISGAAVTQITADDQLEYVDVDLSGVKQYIRVVEATSFTGGSSPTVPASATVVLGGAQDMPAA